MKYSLFGNKAFYKNLLIVAIPIMLQSAITNFVGLVDNVMVGKLGTLQMSAVSISNQLFNVFQLLTFACANASGIFLAQYCGKKDDKGMADSFRFKIYSTLLLCICAIAIFYFGQRQLILLYLGNNDVSIINETLAYGQNYLTIMLLGLLPFSINIVVSYSLREYGNTFLPMISSSVGVFSNALLNYVLIFGNFGFKPLGVVGAAYATVIARIIEMSITVIYTLIKKDELPFISHLFDSYTIPKQLIHDILVKGFPLLINEFFYSIGMAMIVQSYSLRGIEAVAANNIVTTISNVCFVFNIACGNAIAIIVGQQLGAGDIEKARESDTQIIFFSFLLNILIGTILFVLCPHLPNLYNTSNEIKLMAERMLKVYSFYMPISSLYMSSYFTIRSGGNTALTFFFDGFYTACISFPLSYILIHYTSLDIVIVYLIVMMNDIFKVLIGLKLVKEGKWANNIVGTIKD